MFHVKQFLKLSEFCEENNIEYNDNMDRQLDLFCRHLIEINKVMNLTAITDPPEIETKHFIDSIESATVIKNIKKDNMKIIDIGTGAGFPGVPLSVIFPKIRFTLADSLEKRLKFIDECAQICKISNIETIHGRAEDLGHSDLRESFDICVSRAVAAMPVLLEYCLPFIRTGGTAILYKSGDYTEELNNAENALQILGGKVEKVIEFELPDTQMKRSLVIITKTEATPGKYPRKAGKPAKSPL